MSRQNPLFDLEKPGVVQVFKFTHELAWNVMKGCFAYQGNPGIERARCGTPGFFDAPDFHGDVESVSESFTVTRPSKGRLFATH